ncbi:phage/plasmid primase, P4 family [Paenibacillus sp. TRM 82003]|nr:phage/plasmid primase, P4 family [Paenibacillus sp. TRM 82003]
MRNDDIDFGNRFRNLSPRKQRETLAIMNGEFEPDEGYPELLPDLTFDSSTVRTPTSLEAEPKAPRNPVAFEAMMMVLSKRNLICVNDRILVYNDRYGFFEEHTDRQLEVLVRMSISKSVDKHLNAVQMRDVLHRLRSNPELQVAPEELDRNMFLVNFRNGVYDIQVDSLESHSPRWRFTSFIDADYQYDDDDEGKQFLQFLEDCTNSDTNKINSLQEVTGYIIGNEWRAKKFFALIGVPHSGKSVWLTIWKSLVGVKFTTSMSLQQLGKSRFMSAELLNSKLNLSAEMDELGTLPGVALIKSITGGDMLTAERKGRDPFHFSPRTKLVAAGNHMPLPEGSDGTNAFVDRLLFLMFEHSVPEHMRDKELIPKLLQEKNYIARWAIKGLRRLMENNLVFTESDAGIAFRKGYNSEKNSVLAFIKDCCDVDISDGNYREHRRNLFDAYKIYCQTNCIRTLSSADFLNQLINAGFKSHKFRLHGSTPLRGFLGIRLKLEVHLSPNQLENEPTWSDD